VRILVVEDEPRLSAVVRQSLEENGFSVDAVHDGEKLAINFLAMVKVAIIRRYLTFAFSDRA